MTDEQRMREPFEEWVIQDMAQFAAPDSSPAELRANVERRFERDKKTGLYVDECIRDRYRGYRARDAEVQRLKSALETTDEQMRERELIAYMTGREARDAEVQALKHALTELADCAEDATKRLPSPRGSLDYAIWQARTALAGGETGEAE